MSELKPWPGKPEFPPEFNMYSNQYRAAHLDYERARADAWEARCRAAVDWIKLHGKHDESNGQCYGLVRGRYVGDPPDMVYEEHTCRCGLDTLLEAIGPLPPLPKEQKP